VLSNMEAVANSGFRMADIRSKRPTRRRAVAVGEFHPGDAFAAIVERRLPKGDALSMAEVAGLQGAKMASALMPLCHPLLLELVDVRCVPVSARGVIRVYCEVACEARTGVEMEALAGVNTALLTLYDLTKPVQPELALGGIQLLFKEGGKKGLWMSSVGLTADERAHYQPQSPASLAGARCAVLTLSDRAHAGTYEDRSGPLLVKALSLLDAHAEVAEVLPDGTEPLAERLRQLAAEGFELVLCSGGTGLGRRDLTPEALYQVATRRVPGLGELFRSDSRHHTELAWLSRAEAVMVEDCLVIALPGSPRAVDQGMNILGPLLAHALAMVHGEPHAAHGGQHARS
jgi:molybdenum cofactor biosynthesis protein MoaC